jgi:hypothetical protein
VLFCEKLSPQLSVEAGKFTDCLGRDLGSTDRGLHTGPLKKESTMVSHTSWEGTEDILFVCCHIRRWVSHVFQWVLKKKKKKKLWWRYALSAPTNMLSLLISKIMGLLRIIAFRTLTSVSFDIFPPMSLLPPLFYFGVDSAIAMGFSCLHQEDIYME